MVFSREFPQSFGDALKVCREILSANRELVRKGSLETEAEQLVIGAQRLVTGERLDRASFFARLQNRLPEATAERLLVLAGKRSEGALLQHLLAYQAFLDHEYAVDSSTLIPRPETEVLVRTAVEELRLPALGLEIGLGSGVISVELLHAFSRLKMLASEISEGAITLAKRNATSILGAEGPEGAGRLEVIRPSSADEVLEPFSGQKADFLISNPPYLDARVAGETDAEVLAHEPASALFPANGDPLHFYVEIARGAANLLHPGGKVFLELETSRAEQVQALFEKGWKSRLVPDLTGRPRVLIAENTSWTR